MVGLSGLLQMGDSQQPAESGPGQRRCDPDRSARGRKTPQGMRRLRRMKRSSFAFGMISCCISFFFHVR